MIMSNLQYRVMLRVAAFVVAATLAGPLSAQNSAPPLPEPRRGPPSADQVQPGPDASRDGHGAVGETERAPAKPADAMSQALGGQIPPSSAARSKLLADLYALLATAEDEAGAKKVQGAIEKVWSRSGSDTVGVILQRAVKAATDKNEALAETLFDAAVDLAPDYAEAWNRRAFYYYKQNDFTRALGDLRRTLALEPNHFRALEGVATILRETGDERGAFKTYERLLEVNPLGEGVQKGFDELKVKVQGRGI